MTRLSPLVFFGTEDLSAKILHGLINSDFEIEAVITKPDLISGRGRKKRPTKVKQLALKSNIKVFEVTNKDDIRQAVANTTGQTGILAMFGKIIPEDVITAFKNGIINVHPSLLPKHRGPSPIISSILAGDKTTGVSIMLLVNEVDAGPVYSQAKLELTGKETIVELNNKLISLSNNLLIKTLMDIENGLEAKPQDHDKATFCHMVKKSDGILNPTLYTAQELERQVRAYGIWPKSRLKYRDKEVVVLKATVGEKPDTRLSIRCKDDNYLNIETVLSPSGKPTTAQQYINNFLS